jgi:ubiquinone biosynthesis protein Coq4
MMQTPTNSCNPAPHIEKFLSILDHITAAQGLNLPQIVDIELLHSLPADTFGKTWANFLDQNKLQPFTTGTRRKQLHDGVHVLTGYGTDPIGEAELQAFLLGAKYTLSNLMLGLGLLRIIYLNKGYREQFTWDRLQRAYKRGQNSRFDPDNWQPEILWNLQFTEVKTLFSLV